VQCSTVIRQWVGVYKRAPVAQIQMFRIDMHADFRELVPQISNGAARIGLRDHAIDADGGERQRKAG